MIASFPTDFPPLLSTFTIKPQAINSTTISLIAYLTIRNQPQLNGWSLLVRQAARRRRCVRAGGGDANRILPPIASTFATNREWRSRIAVPQADLKFRKSFRILSNISQSYFTIS